VGRRGNVDEMCLANAGLEGDSRGRIPVDSEYRTKVPIIYAAGDVIGFPSLASVFHGAGTDRGGPRLGIKIQSNPATYPYGIYTISEISFAGKTGDQAVMTLKGTVN
jgi:NAD(P) transhydrogenase